MKLSKLAIVTGLLLGSTSVLAQGVWDKFVEDSSFDIKARASGINMSPNDVNVNNTYTSTEAAGILFATGQAPAGVTPEDLVLYLEHTPGALEQTTKDINTALTQEVENAGEVNQGGLSLWGEFESGYLFDMVGFDLGYQGGMKTWNEAAGTLIIKAQDDSYHRVSTARGKVRFGDEKNNVSGFYGRGVVNRMHFGQDADEYLLNKTYEGAEIAAKWGGLEVYALDITGIGEVTHSEIKTAEDFAHFEKAGFTSTHSVGMQYASDYGNAKLANTWSKNYSQTTSVMANSGVPIGWLGFDIADENLLDYLLLFQVNYNWQNSEKDFVNKYGVEMPNIKTDNYEFTIGAQLDSLFMAGSYNKVGEYGFSNSGTGSGGSSDNLVGHALINDFNMPNQTTYSFVLGYNGKNIDLPGLELSAIVLHSRDIDMDAVLAGGNLEYYLTGETEFTESLLEAKYSITDGALEGLSFRGVMGYEDNQANLTGFAGWIEYNRAIF